MTTQRTVPDASALGGWRKSSYSGGGNGNCVEVSTAHPAAAIPVRDSKNPTGPALLFPTPAWSGFLTTLRDGTR
jgi:Domain of unknown function (DUF397)